MDRSETYIKMCEKAEEIQTTWEPIDGDYVYRVIGQHKQLLPRVSIVNSRAYWPKGVQVWLPRQDQLQEMLLKPTNTQFDSILRLLNFFSIFVAVNTNLTSMEQLWLAFVMKEKYNKVWSGEEWVSESSKVFG